MRTMLSQFSGCSVTVASRDRQTADGIQAMWIRHCCWNNPSKTRAHSIMLKASHIHDLWVLKDKQTLKKVAKKLNEEQEKYDVAAKSAAFSDWLQLTIEIRKRKAEEDQRDRFIDVLKNSTRCQRSTMEKEEVRRFVVNNLSCIPKSINFTEMDTLCNELDWIPYIGRSILFLQGDFGNCYYMVARGTVGLYLEPSKDREMVIAREFGHLRLQPFQGEDEDLARLGTNIVNLPQGSGFGEFAILATSNKIRSCAAVAVDKESIMLVMHADTYNAVLRQHHYRQKQLSSATALLQELPLFKHHNFSKVASVAYTMRSQMYSNQNLIVSYGDVINNVMLIASGQVKVYAPPSEDEQVNSVKMKRMPKLAIALLGRGQIIGELEVQKGLRTFQMTYESGASSTELLAMPVTVFKESISAGGLTQSMLYKNIEEMNEAKEQRRVGRMNRAYDAMKTMMGTETKALQSKEQLVKVLPVLVNPPASTDFDIAASIGSNRHSSHRHSVGTYSGDERPAVVRKASFAVKLGDDGHPITGAAQAAAGTIGSSFGSAKGGSLKFASPGLSTGGVGSPDAQKNRVQFLSAKVNHTSSPSATTTATFSPQSTSRKSPGAGTANSPPGVKPSAALMGSPRLSLGSAKNV